jgi:hypothetical protein
VLEKHALNLFKSLFGCDGIGKPFKSFLDAKIMHPLKEFVRSIN